MINKINIIYRVYQFTVDQLNRYYYFNIIRLKRLGLETNLLPQLTNRFYRVSQNDFDDTISIFDRIDGSEKVKSCTGKNWVDSVLSKIGFPTK